MLGAVRDRVPRVEQFAAFGNLHGKSSESVDFLLYAAPSAGATDFPLSRRDITKVARYEVPGIERKERVRAVGTIEMISFLSTAQPSIDRPWRDGSL
jgi:hypothetical protein